MVNLHTKGSPVTEYIDTLNTTVSRVPWSNRLFNSQTYYFYRNDFSQHIYSEVPRLNVIRSDQFSNFETFRSSTYLTTVSWEGRDWRRLDLTIGTPGTGRFGPDLLFLLRPTHPPRLPRLRGRRWLWTRSGRTGDGQLGLGVVRRRPLPLLPRLSFALQSTCGSIHPRVWTDGWARSHPGPTSVIGRQVEKMRPSPSVTRPTDGPLVRDRPPSVRPHVDIGEIQ